MSIPLKSQQAVDQLLDSIIIGEKQCFWAELIGETLTAQFKLEPNMFLSKLFYRPFERAGFPRNKALFSELTHKTSASIGQQLVSQFVQSLPENLKSELLRIEEVEKELGGKDE